MSLELPKSMDECVYYTLRTIGDKGKIRAWVLREKCPECGKGLMGKPRDPKTGKPKIRATEYVCPECNHTVEAGEYEDTLTLNIIYTCPKCGNASETQMPYKRKKIKVFDEEKGKDVAVDAFRFECNKCGEKILIAKKMKI